MRPDPRAMLRLALISIAPLALAACGSAEKKGKDQRTAAGQILPGSISDSMIPYDTVHSQPPLAPKVIGSGKAKDGAASDAGPGDPPVDAAAEAPAAPVEAPAAPAAPTE